MKQLFCSGGFGFLNTSSLGGGSHSSTILGHYSAHDKRDFDDFGGRVHVIPTSGKFVGLRVLNETAPGSGETVRYDLEQDASLLGDTRVTCLNSLAGIRLFEKAVAAGELWNIHTSDSGGASNGGCSWSIGWEGDNSGEAIVGGGYLTSAGGSAFGSDDTNRLYYGMFGQAPDTTEGNVYFYAALSGTITALYIDATRMTGDQLFSGSGTLTFSISVNGTPQASSEIAFDENTSTGNVTGLSISFSAGDTITLSVIASGIDCGTQDCTIEGTFTWGILYEPSTDGESMIGGNAAGAGDNDRLSTTTKYTRMNHEGRETLESAEEDAQNVSLGYFKLKDFSTFYTVAPGGSASRTMTVRKNGSDTSLSTSITGASTSATDSSNVVQFEPGDLFSIECAVSSGTPADTDFFWSAVMYDVELPDIANNIMMF